MGNKGIPSFLLDVNMDDKVKLIKAEFGMKGFGTLVSLWQRIYGTNYYLEWTEEVELLFSDEIKEGRNFVSDVIKSAVKRGLFNQELYDKYKILTSKRIQENYFQYVERRKKIEIVKEYLLTFDILDNTNVYILGENADKNGENASNFKQIKLNQIKSKDKTLDKGSSLNFLTKILIENDYVKPDDINLDKYDCLFDEALKKYDKSDCSQVTKYILEHVSKKDDIQNLFGYFKKSFDDGIKNLIKSRIPKGDFIKDVTKNLKVAEGGKFL